VTGTRSLTLAALCVAALSISCARNAFLELTVDLPVNDRTGDRYAVLRVVTDTPFEQEWEGDNPIPANKLSSTPSSQRISVESNKDSEGKAVRIKAKFCKSPTCTAIGDDRAPEAWLEIERAFYIGQRTAFRWSIACIPSTADDPRR
jgi:hypothetical protein